MRNEPRLWNAGLIILVLSIGFFLPAEKGGQDTTGNDPVALPSAEPDKSPSLKLDKSSDGPDVIRIESPSPKPSASGGDGPKSEEEIAEEWNTKVDEMITKFEQGHEDAKKTYQVVGKEWISEDLTREEIEKGLEHAEMVYRKVGGFLHTMPQEESEAKMGKIREAAYELQYNPDVPSNHVKHAMALEDANLHGPAFNAMGYAFKKFPEDAPVAVAYGDLGRKWSLRHMAEDGYERALQIEPSNDHAKQGLAHVKKWEYHPGYVKLGFIPEERLKKGSNGE